MSRIINFRRHFDSIIEGLMYRYRTTQFFCAQNLDVIPELRVGNIEEEVRNGCNRTDILKAMDLTPIVCAMPECDAVCNTLKGIIGYFYWLKEQERPFDPFVEDALHDLEDCTINYHEKWYESRTLQYVKFFKPE